MQVTPRRLEVFVAVVDHAGFGAAANALNIAQPSVSAHIRALEDKVGSPLFERLPGQAPRLTDAGRTLYTYAQDTLERAKSISAQLGQAGTRLRFAAQRSVATSLLRKPLESFSARYPHVELIVHSGTFEEVHQLFTSGAVDLAFVLSPGEVQGLHTSVLGRYRLAFLAAPDHPLAGRSRIPREELARHPFVAAYRTSYFGRTLSQMLREAGVPPLVIRSQAQEISMLREMMLAGMGISFGLRRSVHKDLATGTLVELDVDVDPMYLQLRVARSTRAGLPEIDRLVEMVREAEAQVA
nr:LysR family transcriptional regulator [Ramlibacter aurantiacus]